MSFNSLEFLLFILVVVIIYYILPQKLRWVLLLITSFYFYILLDYRMLFLLIGITALSYVIARVIDYCKGHKAKTILMVSSVIVCLIPLFFYKYFNFFSSAVTQSLKLISIPTHSFTLSLLLPVGISFYTFKVISYIVDVYKGKTTAVKHIGYYFVYVSFFPEIVSGPIDRANNFIPQLKTKHRLSYENIYTGAQMILWGLFKKVVIADTIAPAVNAVYNNVTKYNGIILLLATFLYTIQIYCDFSGYTDIACGSAKMMGFDLALNFNSPYLSSSIKEFWNRWHVSLSSWLRDYVYIPLGGNRVSLPRYYLNLMITFLVSGLWHGANWNFILWGGIHGAYLVIEAVFKRLFKSIASKPLTGIKKAFKIVFTFILINFAWIFFRANKLSDAFYVVQHIFIRTNKHGNSWRSILVGININKNFIFIFGVAFIVLFIFEVVQYKTNKSTIYTVNKLPLIPRWIIFYFVIFFIVIFGAYGATYNPQSFIYYHF
jgi:alginate O-acetyltransferase complex protein AlgI